MKSWCNYITSKRARKVPLRVLKKNNFLGTSKNNQRLINTLKRFLQNRYCQMYRAKGDADVLIVTTAVEAARERITVLVALT